MVNNRNNSNTNSTTLLHKDSITWVGTHPVNQGKSQVRSLDLWDKMHWGIQECFPTEPGNLQVAPSSKNRCPPRDTNYVTVVSVGDALGRGVTSDLMSSCLAGHSWCKGDLTLFITGAGSSQQTLSQQCLWVAVLALLVLRLLSVPNVLVHK